MSSSPEMAPKARVVGSSYRFLLFLSRYGTLASLFILIVVFAIASPDSFFTVSNLVNILNQSALTALISGGLTMTLIVGEFDLSIGYAASFAGVVVAGMMVQQGLPVALAVLVVLSIGGFIGGVNGVLVAKARINAVIATLGIGTILVGISYTYSSGVPIAAGLPQSFLNLALGKVVGVPNTVWITGLVLVVLWIVVNWTDFGQWMQAVGGNVEAARLTGIAVDRVRILAFVVSGACAGLTGILLASLIGSGTLDAADSYLLSAFAAVFLGSATLRDGEFHILGTAIGVIIINVVINGLSIFGVPTSYQNIVIGGILVAAVALSTIARRYVRGT